MANSVYNILGYYESAENQSGGSISQSTQSSEIVKILYAIIAILLILITVYLYIRYKRKNTEAKAGSSDTEFDDYI